LRGGTKTTYLELTHFERNVERKAAEGKKPDFNLGEREKRREGMLIQWVIF